MRAVVVSGVIACAVLVTAAHEARSQSRTDTVATAPGGTNDANFDVRGTSKMMGEAASRLKEEAAEKDKKLQELEADLKKNQQNNGVIQKDMGEIVLIMRGAADGLAPDADYRMILAREGGGVHNSANQAEADLDREIRQRAPYLQEKASEIDALTRDAEETRTRLVTQIDLLEELKDRVPFGGATARIDEPVKNARGYLEGIQAIAMRAERLATELYNYEGSGAAKSAATPTAPATTAAAAQPRTTYSHPLPRRPPTSITPPTPAPSTTQAQ